MKQHLCTWRDLTGHRHGKLFISGPCGKRANNLLRLSRRQLKMVVAILTGHAPVRKHLRTMGCVVCCGMCGVLWVVWCAVGCVVCCGVCGVLWVVWYAMGCVVCYGLCGVLWVVVCYGLNVDGAFSCCS
jgi:hypothetical protein